ncbi:PD-(D/E)XK nuclease family protein, partial [Enterococcus faecium]|uniref:PD-(D/E)XK nuclease family protein n=2 Tax=Enterococcus faecium TaxID=1352 RepID=UPI00338F1CD8
VIPPAIFFYYSTLFDSRFKTLQQNPLLNSYEDLIVYRENKNIDILLVSEKNKIVVCIENKILSSESGGQLNKYQIYIERNYSNYKKIFVFLTPDGNEPTNPSWGIITYKNIVEESVKYFV